MSSSRLPAFVSPLHVPMAGGIPTPVVHEILESGEEWIWGEDGVGLYHSNSKMPYHQSLSVQLTTHRLLLIHSPQPSSSNTPTSNASPPLPESLQLSLSYIRQTEFYTGFMRSSAKISLFLGYPETNPDDSGPGQGGGSGESWTCGVCGFNNEPKGFNGSGGKCSLCGVARVIGNSGVPTRVGTPVQGMDGNSSSSSSPLPASASTCVVPRGATEPTISKKSIPCPRCTFLNHPSLVTCEICGSPLPLRPSASTSTPNWKPGEGTKEVVRLSFRKGGEKEMYRRLKSVLAKKTWSGEIPGKEDTARSNGSSNGRAGIDGIIQNMSLESKAQEEKVQDAFQDLDALMVRAGEMVKLVQTLNSRLTSQQITSPSSTTTEDDQTLIRSSLVQMGLPTPALTQDMVKGEQAYLEGLARELGALLTGGKERKGYMMEEGKGVVGLDEIWAVWNRVRGVSLVSPKDFRSSIKHLPQYSNPTINHLTHSSGLSVLHTPHFSLPAFSGRLQDLLRYPSADEEQTADMDADPGMTTIDIALHEKIAVGFATELLTMIEMDEGSIARDAQGTRGGGEKWYINFITGYVWDDPNA